MTVGNGIIFGKMIRIGLGIQNYPEISKKNKISQ
jgi:hypothetical protein